jgi:hypothetical protein
MRRLTNTKRPLLAAAGLLAALALSATAVAATVGGGTAKDVSFSEPATLPCTGQSGTADLLVNGTTRTVETNAGTHLIFVFEGTETFTPDGASAPTYAGHATGTSELTTYAGSDQSREGTSMFRARLVAADGSVVQAQNLIHLTLLSDGSLAASVDHVELRCA